MTPPINSEISKKLRAAIRAKLEELGVYVDDELPDYIMVMIANKKEKKQMKDDLTLFLSKNTDSFVDWLFDICHRLQSAPTSAPVAETKPVKETKKEKTTTKEKKKTEGSSVKKIGERKDEKAKKKVASADEKEREREREKKEKKEAERREIERANREDRERRDREEKEKRDREERRLREERDKKDRERERKEREQRDREREEEKQKEREREKRRERERDERETPPAKRRHSPIRARRALSPDAPAPSAAVRRRVVEERIPEKRKDTVSSSVTRAVSPPPVSVQSKIVVKRQVRAQNDKAGTKGASSMFLRAMNAASVSAGYGGGAGGPVSRKRPVPNARPAAHDDDDVPEFSDEDEFANGDVEEEEEEVKEVEEVEVVPRKKAVPATRRVVQPPVEKKVNEEPRFIVTFNKKEEEEKRKAVKRGARDEKEEEEEDGAVRVSSAPRKTITVSGEKRRREVSGGEEDEGTRKRMSISVSPPLKHSSPTDWDGQINLNDDETSDEEAAIDAVLASTRASRVSSRGGETERLPPTSQLSRGNSYYEPYDPSQPAVTAVVHVAPQTYVPTPLSHSMARAAAANPNKIQERCKFFPNCKEGDTCIYLHPATRHCTNFPRCSFGSRCMYTHPKCKFDAACSKPACPFTHTVQKKAVAVVAPRQTVSVVPVAAVAAPAAAPIETAAIEEKKPKIEPDVPLVPAPAPSIRARPSSTLSASIPCRFAAGCTNPLCAYKHPKECRFGQNCSNSYCYFYHPPAGRLPTAAPPPPAPAAPFFASPSKLKWKAPAAATAAKTEQTA